MQIFHTDKKHILHSICLCMIMLICFDTCFFEFARHLQQDTTGAVAACDIQETEQDEHSDSPEWPNPEYRTRNIQFHFSDYLFTAADLYSQFLIYPEEHIDEKHTESGHILSGKAYRTHLMFCTLLI